MFSYIMVYGFVYHGPAYVFQLWSMILHITAQLRFSNYGLISYIVVYDPVYHGLTYVFQL